MEYKGKTVSLLYVDDEQANIFLFKISFQKDFKIYTASSGEQGLEILDANPNEIIVVISDMRMPKMNGVQFVKKAKEKYSHIAYFILTGFDFNEEIEEALSSGIVNQFFTKPFNAQDIKRAIQNFLETGDNE